MKVVNGSVVPIDTPDPVAPKPPRPPFPNVRGSWVIDGTWTLAPKSEIINPAEKENQRQIIGYWRSLGCRGLNFSQVRASKVALGVPDLYTFGPPHLPLSWWWECKKPGPDAELSDEQIAFALHCARTRTPHGCGPASAALAFSAAIGLGGQARSMRARGDDTFTE